MKGSILTTRALTIREQTDGTVIIEVQFPRSRSLHGCKPVLGRGHASRTWWILDQKTLKPAHAWSADGLIYARTLHKPLKMLLDEVDKWILEETSKYPPDALTDARNRIALLEAEVKVLKRKRRKR